MSKLGKLGNFFNGMAKFALPILMMTPLAPIARVIVAAMQEAEALHTGPNTGADKLKHVLAIALDAALGVNIAAGHMVIDPAVLQQVVTQVVGAIVGVVNVVQHPVGLPESVEVGEGTGPGEVSGLHTGGLQAPTPMAEQRIPFLSAMQHVPDDPDSF